MGEDGERTGEESSVQEIISQLCDGQRESCQEQRRWEKIVYPQRGHRTNVGQSERPAEATGASSTVAKAAVAKPVCHGNAWHCIRSLSTRSKPSSSERIQKRSPRHRRSFDCDIIIASTYDMKYLIYCCIVVFFLYTGINY